MIQKNQTFGVDLCPSSSSADPERDWTPHRAERCLWAWAVAGRLQLPLLEEQGGGGEGRSPEADERPTKKRRTD